MTQDNKSLSKWYLEKEDGTFLYFERKELSDKEFAQTVLGVSDEEMKHYVPNSLKEVIGPDGRYTYTASFKYKLIDEEKKR